MRIGFDVAQTCQQRAGCAWYADMLIRSIAKIAPEHEYALYHQFDGWHNETTKSGTRLEIDHHAPFFEMPSKRSNILWNEIRSSGQLPHQPEIVHSTSFQAPKLKNSKLVFTVYDLSFWIFPEYTTEANRVACQKGLLNALLNADGLLFISESAHTEFERTLPGWLAKKAIPFEVTPLGFKKKRKFIRVKQQRRKQYVLAVSWLS